MPLMMRMMDAWVRGAHPWCGWLRLFLLPGVLVPAWFGWLALSLLVMATWMLLPMAFRKPVDTRGWMSRAQLGLQVWRSRPLEDPLCLLALGGIGAVLGVGLLAAAHGRAVLVVAGALACLVIHLSLLARCVTRFDAVTRPLRPRN